MKKLNFIAISLFTVSSFVACEKEEDAVNPVVESEAITTENLASKPLAKATSGTNAIQHLEKIKGTWQIKSLKVPFEDADPISSMDLNRLFGPATSASTGIGEVTTVTFDEVSGATFKGPGQKYVIPLRNYYKTPSAASKILFNFDLAAFVQKSESIAPLSIVVDQKTGNLRMGKFRDSDFFEYLLEKQGGTSPNTRKSIKDVSELTGRWLVKSGSLTSPKKFKRTNIVRSGRLLSPLKGLDNVKALEFVNGGTQLNLIRLNGTIAGTLSVRIERETILISDGTRTSKISGVLVNGKTLDMTQSFNGSETIPRAIYKFRKVR